jgi:hypothetical protein
MEANGVRSKSSSGGLTTLPATHRDRIPAMKFLALLLLLAAPGVANEPKDLPDYACPKHRIASQHTGITRSTGEGVKLCQSNTDTIGAWTGNTRSRFRTAIWNGRSFRSEF